MMTPKTISKKYVGLVAVISLAITGIFGLGAPANAVSESTPTIIFDGNILATSLPATETATRDPGTNSLSTAALDRVVATTRAGYAFAGWSLTSGGAVTNVITTTNTTDTSRTIYAVWNTRIAYDATGVVSGDLTGGKTQDTYRFGQTLTLPTGGTLAKPGFAFGGWMTSSLSATRLTTYRASTNDVGNPTLYAAWIKTVTFNGNSASSGTIPASQIFVAGGAGLKLPVISEMTLRKPGYDFMGWATTATGQVISNPGTYVPLVSQQNLFAIWRIQSTKASSRVFFKPGKSGLRAGQKLAIRDLVDSLQGRNAIQVTVAARRHNTATKKLGKKRNTAVVRYLRSLGVEATFTRSNKVGPGGSSSAKKNNRVTLQAGWTNPTT